MNTFINSFFGNFKMFDMTKETKLDIDYRLYLVPKEKKEERLLSLIRQINPLLSMIFVSNTAKAEWLYSYLKDNKINVCLYSAKLSINGRKKLFLEISRGKYQYVITTDVMSRGIDLIVSDVINYDFPKNFEYIWHRFGRTGRMNKKGCVHILAFSDSSEQVSINKLRSSNIELSEYKLDDDVLSKVIKKKRNDEELSLRIKAIPRPRKVTPNYKKKNQEKIKKVKQGLVKERAKEAARRKPNL
jgi:ATP-dependent RNA helicase CshB